MDLQFGHETFSFQKLRISRKMSLYYLDNLFLVATAHGPGSRFLLCPVWRGLPVLREGKWAASEEDIPPGTDR